MRPSVEEVMAKMAEKLGENHNCTVFSLKFICNTEQWIARLKDEMEEGQSYYRVAEGFGEHVTYISPRMPCNAAFFGSDPGPLSNRGIISKIKSVKLETVFDKRNRDYTRLEFEFTLDHLFEGRES